MHWLCFIPAEGDFVVNTQPGRTAYGSDVTDFFTCFAADALPVS